MSEAWLWISYQWSRIDWHSIPGLGKIVGALFILGIKLIFELFFKKGDDGNS